MQVLHRTSRMGSALLRVLMLALLLAGFGSALTAQTDTGRVTGTVADNSGAIIPGATVTLTDTDTGAISTRTTGSDGTFTFPALVRGHYSIQTSAAGFTAEQQAFELQLQQVQAIDFKLNPGATNTTVEVTGAAPIVDVSTSSTGEVIEGRQVTDLPLDQRNFLNLAELTPGVTRGAYGSDASGVNQNVETIRYSDGGGGALTVNGLRAQANNFLLDGLDNNESLVNTIVIFPSPDAIQEFRVTTAVAAAEFGRAGGAIVNASIKSGTNQIHGTAFGYFRDQIFDANSQYFNPGSAPIPFQRKQFGFAAGGPILKNRLFLFGDYQALRQKQPQDSGFQTVPTALMRTGNFTELLGLGTTTNPSNFSSVTGCTGTVAVNGGIYDPTTCQQFGAGTGQANIIPTSRINPAGINYLNAFDNPTRAGVLNNFFVTRRNITNYNDFNVRLDYHLSGKDSVFGRYSYGQDNNTITSLFTKLPAGFASGDNVNHPRGIAAGETHLFTNNLVNEFRFGYNRPFYAYEPPDEGTPVSQNLGIVNANRNSLLGGGALIGGSNTELAYTGDGGPYSVPEKTYQYADALTWTHGLHTIKGGANILRREVDFFQGNDAKGSFVIGGINFPGTGRFTGYETSELLAGFTDYQIGAASTFFRTFNYETGYFIQDDWKATRRLTLNLGFRYDLYTFPYEQNNNQANYNIPTGQLLIAGQNGNSRSLVNTNKGDFAPRVGFAYDVYGNGRTSIRGGYGIYYFLDRGGIGNQLSNNPGFNGLQTYTAANGFRVTFTGQGPTGDNNSTAATAALPLPVFGASAITPALVANSSVIAEVPNNKNSSAQQYDLQLQQQIDRYTSFTIAYVGNKTDHLATYFNANAPQLLTGVPTYTNVQTITENLAEGTGRYDGLQLSLNRRVANNLFVTGAYTWSHTRDNSNGAFGTGASASGSRFFIENGQPQFKLNYGNSDQDQRNVFVGSIVYSLPYGHGQRFGASAPRILDETLGGWQINSLTTVDSGTPFDITTGGGQLTFTNAAGASFSAGANTDNRADVISFQHVSRNFVGGSANANNRTYFTGTFAAPPTVTVNGNPAYLRPGNVERNQFFGPGFTSEDIGLFKDFAITERVKFQLRAQAYNLFNTPEFTNPDTSINDGVKDYATGTVTTGPGFGFGSISATRSQSERQLEFAARINF